MGGVVLIASSLVKLALVDSLDTSIPFLMNLIAVLAAAWYGGLAAGSVITLSSALVGYFGFMLARSPELGAADTEVMVFVAEGLALSWLADRLSRERWRALEAAHEAREATEKLALVLAGIKDGITMQDHTGRLVYANEPAAHIVGFQTPRALLEAPPADLIRRFELYDAAGAPLPVARLPNRAIFAGEAATELLVQYNVRDDVERRWSAVSATGAYASDGSLRFVVNVFRDVTELQRQEQELRVRREWFSTALSSIGDAVIATDPSSRVTFLNPVACSLTGWSSEDAAGQPLARVFPILDEATREPVPSPAERVIADGVVVGLGKPTLLVRRDGQEIAVDESAAPIRSNDGTLAGVVVVFRDVTAERRASDRREFLARASIELNSSLHYEDTLATVARLAVPRLADWCTVDVIEQGELKRLAVAHVDASKIAWVEELQRRYPPDPDATRGTHHILRTGKAEMMSEIPLALIDASARDPEHLRLLRQLALHSYIGVPIARGDEIFGVLTLVTAESRHVYTADDLEFAMALADRAAIAVENARLFRAAERARTEAEQANRAKDDFLAMLGHELRNPLAPIVTALDMMKRRPDADLARERLTIERQVKHVVRLVDDLLDVSRIVHGRITLARERVLLGEVLDKALELAGPLIDERRQHVAVSVDPELAVLADGVRLTQVLTNLLTNAAKYTDPGGHIRVRIGREQGSVLIEIDDDGVGIAPEMLARIFELFVQAPQTIDRARGGLGLGLAIVQSLVSSFGGSVSATSPGPGQGSTFLVRLPLLEPGDVVAAPAPPPMKQPLRILIVDDNTDALDMLAEALRLLGHEPYPAGGADAALDLARVVKPALALLDIGLPSMDGYELGRRLRALPGLERLPLVALTGYGQASDRERSQAAGFNAHLVKPVELSVIEQVLHDIDDPHDPLGVA